jgi:hypothetical protein
VGDGGEGVAVACEDVAATVAHAHAELALRSGLLRLRDDGLLHYGLLLLTSRLFALLLVRGVSVAVAFLYVELVELIYVDEADELLRIFGIRGIASLLQPICPAAVVGGVDSVAPSGERASITA